MSECYFICGKDTPGAVRFRYPAGKEKELWLVRRECGEPLRSALETEAGGWLIREYYSEDDDHGDAFRYFSSDTIFHDVTPDKAIVKDGTFAGAFFRNKATDEMLPVLIGDTNYTGRTEGLSDTHGMEIQSQGKLVRREAAEAERSG